MYGTYGIQSTDLRLNVCSGCGLGLELPLVSSAPVPGCRRRHIPDPFTDGRWPVRSEFSDRLNANPAPASLFSISIKQSGLVTSYQK
ncbi:hypothetical protein N7488_009603 [Penicillium malachiteum]|nr:hypothetical protein N7488_009603 [Penicillium malachiteum]